MYTYAKRPWEAFSVGWEAAGPLTRREADARFRHCIEEHSRLGRCSPVAWGRWLGVRLGGHWPWQDHRAHDTMEVEEESA